VNEIRALLKTAARRLELTSFIGKLHWVAIVFACIALALMVSDRVASGPFVPWIWVGPALLGMTFVAAALLWARNRTTESHVALVVDDRLDLREKLSTALHCQGRDDAFAQAAIEDAVLTARDGRTKELVRRRFSLTPPAGWWLSPIIVFAALMISLMNPLNLFARDPQADPAVQQARREAHESVDAMVKAIEKNPELKKEMSDLLGELSKEGTDPKAQFKPDDEKRSALKTATEINKKLDDIINGDKSKTSEALEKALNQLKVEDGPAKEMADAMASGDFEKAQKALAEMMQKAQNGQMNEEEKKKLAEQLKDIAEQLDKLAQQQQQLQQSLQQAGMDPKLAQNAQALQQAIQNNPNLNQQQKQQLQQMAQAQKAACQACQGMGQACQQMAQACQGGQMGQMGQAAGQMAQQLGQMEQMQQLLQQAQAAANACQGQCNKLGEGLCMAQAMQQWKKQGGGMGQWGQGSGGKAPIAPTPTGTKQQKAPVNTVDGEVIAKQLFDGKQIVKGNSKAEIIKVIEQARKGFDEALTEDQMHVKYRDAQQHYFGELEKITKGEESSDPKKDDKSASKTPREETSDSPADKPAQTDSSKK